MEQTGKKTFYLLTGAILSAVLAATSYSMTKFLTVDEPKWLVDRIPRFFAELTSFHWHKLFICNKPGVTLSWLVEAGLVFTKLEGSWLTLGDPRLLFFSRLPLIIANTLLLLWLTLLVRRVLKSNLAAVCFLALTAVNPTIMGMMPIVNPDSLSWFFPLASIILFVLYLDERRRIDMVMLSLIFAAGVLNKFNYLIILPFMPLTAFIFFLFRKDRPGDHLRFAAIAILRVYLLSWLIAVFIWPYLIIAPQEYLRITLWRSMIKPFLAPLVLILLAFYFFGPRIEEWIKRIAKPLRIAFIAAPASLSLALITLTFILTPRLPSILKATTVRAGFAGLIINNYWYHIYSQTTLALILYVAACLFLTVSAFKQGKDTDRLLIASVSLWFVLLYLIGSAATGHITVARYQIPVFPAVGLLIAASLPAVLLENRKAATLVVALTAVVNFALVLPFAPYYLFYYNHFLPPEKLLFEGWGLGGYEAARYLNDKPNAAKLKAYASWSGFDVFFKGRSIGKYENPFELKADYLVIFKQGEQTVTIANDPAKNAYWRRQAKPEYKMSVNGVPVIKVIKVRRP